MTLTQATVDGEWTRAQWLAFADRLLAGARGFASPGAARITPPGAEGGYGRDVDGLEGFARTLLIAGFRIAGARGEAVDELIEFYRRGIVTGVDPGAQDRWVRLDEHPQAKVEAASIALVLDMTRPWIWETLDATTQQRVIDYFAPAVGDASYPRTNWLWFRLVVQTFLRSVGGPWSPDDVAEDLALHDSFARADGWLSDGDERSYDHYVGWALHLYPVLWSRMKGASELGNGREAADIAMLDRFLLDAAALVGGDGAPLFQGRSLIYRFAAAAPFWVGALAGVPSTSLGALRHAANRIVAHFADAGVPDSASDLLTMGWHGQWRGLAQAYSGPASPYWAAKGLLGIALPEDHPVWTAPAEPLPVESRDTLRLVRAPGWVVSGTQADGIVRVINHGTDHAVEGSLVGDSPLYARIGYSTATTPLLDGDGWRGPLEQSVAIVDESGHATHRAAMDLIEVRIDESSGASVGVAASTWSAHWITPDATQARHGSGISGDVTIAGRLTVHSFVRGPWELRTARVDELEPGVEARRLTLRIGGWAVSGDDLEAHEAGAAASASTGRLRSVIHSVCGQAAASIVSRRRASPFGPVSAVPVLAYPVAVDTTVAALVELAGTDVATGPPGNGSVFLDSESAVVTWPDGVTTSIALTERRIVTAHRLTELDQGSDR